MDKREVKVRRELSEILKTKDSVNRDSFVREISAFMWTEAKRIDDTEMIELLEEKNQLVYVI